EQAMRPRCTRCQSLMQPSSAEYWHIGDTTMRFGSVTPPIWIGVNSLGSGNVDSFLVERWLADRGAAIHQRALYRGGHRTGDRASRDLDELGAPQFYDARG